MKRIVALVAVGMFAVSFAAQAGCSGSIHSASTPQPTTTALDTVSQPVQTPKIGS